MYPRTKQVFDRLLALILVVVLAPLLAALALLNVAGRGPVFVRETRVSRGRTFGLIKFNTAVGGELTWAGRRVLRPWYLDELPQLFNILAGDISFVGPRPWPPEMVARQVAGGLDYRNVVIAGLTGTAQVTKGATGARYADRDLEYVDVLRAGGAWRVVRFDLGILARTIGVLARREGLNY
jgi:lipopolysaccharide/colanic/teichoic acid biosynthesis glycosyltransferase